MQSSKQEIQKCNDFSIFPVFIVLYHFVCIFTQNVFYSVCFRYVAVYLWFLEGGGGVSLKVNRNTLHHKFLR